MYQQQNKETSQNVGDNADLSNKPHNTNEKNKPNNVVNNDNNNNINRPQKNKMTDNKNVIEQNVMPNHLRENGAEHKNRLSYAKQHIIEFHEQAEPASRSDLLNKAKSQKVVLEDALFLSP